MSLPPPPPPLNPVSTATSSSSSTTTNTTTSIIIVIIIISSAVIISASIYLLLRFFSRRFHRTFSTTSDVILPPSIQCHVSPQPSASLLDSLPTFTFKSLKGNLSTGDCAVCLSKFEPEDHLRLLPLCCHAFHSTCIDTWIVSNRTCPLCRSSVLLPSDSELLGKTLVSGSNSLRNAGSGNGSFRIEIGSVSRRGGEAATSRSYSIGSFDYIVDDNNGTYEVDVGSTNTVINRTGSLVDDDKELSENLESRNLSRENLVNSMSGRSWLREYMDRLSAVSFRGSGRFFTGSSRRSDIVVVGEDLEAGRAGEEISELFRWLSGV